jgi:hypothetical protein
VDASSAFGDLSLSGRNVTVNETDSISLQSANVDSMTLISATDITDVSNATLNATGAVSLTAGGSVVLGDGTTNPVNFGTLAVIASDGDIIESSATQLAGLSVSNDFTLSSAGSITDEAGATIDVGGRARIAVTGVTQSLTLDGSSNRFGSMNLDSNDIVLVLADSSTIANVRADSIDVTGTGLLTIGEDAGSVLVDQQMNLDGVNALFAQGSQNELGSLTITASESVDVQSSIGVRIGIVDWRQDRKFGQPHQPEWCHRNQRAGHTNWCRGYDRVACHGRNPGWWFDQRQRRG